MTDPPGTGSRPPTAAGRAAVVFIGLAYGTLEAVDLFSDRFGLPDWTFTAVAAALAIGFPIIVATSWFSALRKAAGDDGRASRPLPALHRLFTWRKAALGGVGVFALIGVLQSVTWIAGRGGLSEAEWVEREGVSSMRAHADAGDWESAYEVALRVLASGTADTLAMRMANALAPVDTIRSEPNGASVYRRSWTGSPADLSEDWELLGTTPIVTRVPRVWKQYRFEMEGHAPAWAAWSVTQAGPDPVPTLVREGDPTARMVRISERRRPLYITGLDHLRPPEDLPAFLIDRFEVTSREYKAFLDAGGYENADYWAEAFLDEGRELPFAEAVARFVDTTGRLGPATWVAGDYPDGQGDFPVTGVSWFEAAAYARFAGKSLPTVWHWNRASTAERADRIVPSANLARGKGPLQVGSSQSMSSYGVFDMAGNAREWVYNADPEQGSRYLLGGGWGDPDYALNDAYGQDPWDRSETNGFRLAVYEDPDHPAVVAAREPLASLRRDFYAETPVTDEVFEVYRGLYAYDEMPLNAVVEETLTTDDFIGERVTLDAAYGGERLMAYIYRPVDVEGPLQTVVYFPGSGFIYRRESQIGVGYLDFIVKSGRAVILPVYKGTLERGGELNSDYPEESTRYRQYVIQWVQDFNRVLDYVEERPDLDEEKIGYYGFSWGGALGGLVPAVSPRVKAVVLYVAGLLFQPTLPEAEVLNYLPRVTQPVLMINGEHDYFFPVETAQNPMFEFLGTPAELKRHVVYPGTHNVPQVRLVQESLDWFDAHLGPVGN